MDSIEWTMDDDRGDVHQTQPEERQPVPEGTHQMTIKAAKVGPNQYRTSDANPDGICLSLRLELDSAHLLVFDDLPQDKPWRAGQLARALGIEPDGSRLRLSPDVVMGKTVVAMVERYTSKAGKVSSVIKRYLEPKTTGQPVAKSPPVRKPVAKVSESFEDDIPF